MKVTINGATDTRKVMAFVNFAGELVMRNRSDENNTVLNTSGKVYKGCRDFNEYLESTKEYNKPIYEGDSITIQF